ncbi:SipW-dependent-type signal peptide-containing protein [Microbacterium sp. NPDC055683]
MQRKDTRKAARSGRTWRRVRALLAAGVVLGIGSGATLAAWNDTEYTTATLTASTFGIVGAADGATFTEHNTTGTAATLAFSTPATAMSPSTTTYALYSVRTISSSLGGTLKMNATTTASTLSAQLTYGVRTITGTTCNLTTFNAGAEILARGAAMTASPASTQTLTANAGTAVNYCIEITMSPTAPSSVQGQSAALSWEFVGTSSS